MNNPYPVAFDTTKLNMLKSFAMDEGFRFPEIAVMIITGDTIINQTNDYARRMIRMRLAWSLIKCGCDYHYGRFHYQEGNNSIDYDLESMLTYIWQPLANYWNK